MTTEGSRSLSLLAIALFVAWVLFALLIVWPFATFVSVSSPSESVVRETLAGAQWLKPEPAERASFWVGIFFLPLVTYAVWRVLARVSRPWPHGVVALVCLHLLAWVAGNEVLRADLNVLGLFLIPLTIVLISWSLHRRRIARPSGVVIVGFIAAGWFIGQSHGAHFLDTLAALRAWWFGIPIGVAYAFAWKRDNVWFIALVGTLTLVIYALAVTWPAPTSSLYWQTHFQVIFSPVANVSAGGTMLVDVLSMYGTYADVLAPVLDVLSSEEARWRAFAGMLVVLTLLEKAGLLYVALKAIGHRPTALLTWIAAVCASELLFNYSNAMSTPREVDPYFQLHPLRSIATTLALVLGAFSANGSFKRMIAAAVFSALSIFWWTPEFGIVGFGSVFAMHLTIAIATRAPARRFAVIVVTFAAALALSWASFTLFTWLRSGALPRWSMLTETVAIFYGAGFCMMPMPATHPWILIASCYVLGAFVTLRSFIERVSPNEVQRLSLVTLVTAIGIGQFTYYQGRSYDGNLYGVVAPALLLLGIAADWLSQTSATKSLATGILAVLGVIAVSATASLPTLFSMPPSADQPSPWQGWEEDVAFYKARTQPGQRRLIVSPGAALFHIAGQTHELARKGLYEDMMRSEGAELERTIMAHDALPIFVDRRVSQFFDMVGVVGALRNTISSCFEVIETSASGQLELVRLRADTTACHPALQTAR